MTRKQWILLAFAVLLGGASFYLNRDWFATNDIQIIHRSRSGRTGLFRRSGGADDSAAAPVFFLFNRRLKLKDLKVVAERDSDTNKYPHALWHLVSESNSAPVKEFAYGMHIPGMHPEVKGAAADALEPGITYRLLIEAGSLKAEHDFVPAANSP
ncbi:conserved exported hypothetical protein [Verrucomicrobia bacterium]|nr:conserved exported hypothetical protein [Verrucomicrobiota bacterium]